MELPAMLLVVLIADGAAATGSRGQRRTVPDEIIYRYNSNSAVAMRLNYRRSHASS